MKNTTTTLSTKSRRRLPLRHFIALVIFIAMLPPVVLLSYTLLRTSEADRTAAEERFLDNAKLLAGMVESAVGAHASMIQSFANSPDELALLGDHFSGEIEVAPAPISDNWRLGNLFDIQEGVGARVRLSIPLDTSQGHIALDADVGALTSNIDLTTDQNSQMLIAVVDGNGRVVARSVQQQQFIGRPVPTWQALLAVNADTGLFDAELLEGGTITFAFSKIPNTDGWAVVLGTPKAIFDARWQEPLIVLAIGAIISVIAAIALSTWMASLVVAPVTGLVHRARAILRDVSLDDDLAPTPILELAELQSAQTKAQQPLMSRARELAISTQRYRAMAKVGALVTWRSDIEGNMLELEGWDELTGEPWDSSSTWMSKIHPDDALRTQQLWLDQRQTPHTIDVELRILAAHNDYVWLKCRGAPILNDRSEVIEWIGTLENIDEQKRRHLHVSHLAYHDSLTGLANRSQLDQHLETAWHERERGQHAALLYIDLDRFKQANDRYGHATGDDLLRHVARRLKRLTRPSDIAARIGGDEFAIVLHDIQDPSVSQLIGMRIVKALSKPYEISGQTVEIGASVGIAILTAETADIPTWMKEADSALYTAKTTGRNRSQLYAPPGPIEQSI